MKDEALGFGGQYDSALFFLSLVTGPSPHNFRPMESFPLDRDPRSLLDSNFFTPQGSTR